MYKMYKVIQWASGTLGTKAMQLVIDDPGLQLAGLYVHSEAKLGKDAGEIAGRPATGVRATNRIEDILAIEADAVLYYPMLTPATDAADREVQALLRSGKNVISIRGHRWPRWRGAAYENAFLEACKAGNATLTGVGFHPCYIYDRIGSALTGIVSYVREMRFYEGFNLLSRPPHTIFDVCGMGADPALMHARHPLIATLTELYTEQLACMAHDFGSTLQGVEVRVETVPAERDIEIFCGRIAKHTLKAISVHWIARLAGGTLIDQNSRWFIEPIPGWDARNVWKVKIDGVPSLSMEFTLDAPQDGLAVYDPMTIALASAGVNAIPAVVAAPAGILAGAAMPLWQERYNKRFSAS